jgi:hypothetical protein
MELKKMMTCGLDSTLESASRMLKMTSSLLVCLE